MSAVQLTPDEELLHLIAENQYYPERLAMILWPWGEGDLEGIEQPDKWQMEDLRWLGEQMRARKPEFEATGTAPKILECTGSGRGIGKNVKISMLAVIFMAAFPDAKISVLANTGGQLETKTWPGIRTWLRRSLVAHWFEINSSIMFRHGARESWFCVPITWSLENTQASAGQHNLGSANIFLFDEISQIPNKVIEVALAGLVTGMAIASGIGNPTEPDGVLADALNGKTPTEMNPSPYGKWHARSIDSRTCRFPNKTEIDEMVGYYGEDSDWVRVWVRGIPPKGSIHGYFGETLISEARKARPRGTKNDALVAAVDFAWGGDDNNNISFGEGLDMWSIKPLIIPGRETARPEKMIQVLAEVMTKNWPVTSGGTKRIAMLFGDGSGICTEVFAGLYTLGITNVMSVNWSGEPRDARIHKNIKAQLMSGFRDVLLEGAGIEDDEDLAQDMRELLAVNFLPLQFEKKELMKKRLGRSTDALDSKAMLRYMPVISRRAGGGSRMAQAESEKMGSGKSVLLKLDHGCIMAFGEALPCVLPPRETPGRRGEIVCLELMSTLEQIKNLAREKKPISAWLVASAEYVPENYTYEESRQCWVPISEYRPLVHFNYHGVNKHWSGRGSK